MVSPIRKFGFTLPFIASLVLMASPLWAEVSAQLDRNIITLNDTTNLIISAEDNAQIDNPTLQHLQKNFNVSSRGQSSNTSCINFECTSTTKATYQLSPKRIGLFTIPAISINGEKTQPLQLTVKAANNNPHSKNVDPVFIEMSISADNVYVQQQIVVTFKVNNSTNLSELSLSQEYTIDDAIVKLIDQKTYEQHINGKLYKTAELSYSVIPQKSGELLIPALQIQASSPSLFRSRSMRVKSDIKNVVVKAQPQNNSQHWLPAQHVQIEESWSADISQIQIGDSITRSITTTAVGLAAEQLPPIKLKSNGKFKSYPDQAKLEDQHNKQGIVGIRTDNIAIVATKAGKIELPALKIAWWDTENHVQKYATLPAITLTVIPNGDSSVSTQELTPKTQPATSNPAQSDSITAENTSAKPLTVNPVDAQELRGWKIATGISSLIAFILLILYVRKGTNRSNPVQTDELINHNENADLALKSLERACQQGDSHNIRDSLKQWAKATWPNLRFYSLMDVARQIGNDELTLLLKQLDAEIFSNDAHSGNGPENYKRIIQLIQPYIEQSSQRNKNLTTLYPVN